MMRLQNRLMKGTVAMLATFVFGLTTALIAGQNSQSSPARQPQPPVPMQNAVTKYVAAWSRTTEPEILEMLKECWTPDSTYTDPGTNTARGPVELARVILNFHKALPGATLTATSRLDVHHNFGRFSWQLNAPAQAGANGVATPQVSEGFDFVEFSADGTRILKIVGFFGPFPR